MLFPAGSVIVRTRSSLIPSVLLAEAFSRCGIISSATVFLKNNLGRAILDSFYPNVNHFQMDQTHSFKSHPQGLWSLWEILGLAPAFTACIRFDSKQLFSYFFLGIFQEILKLYLCLCLCTFAVVNS